MRIINFILWLSIFTSMIFSQSDSSINYRLGQLSFDNENYNDALKYYLASYNNDENCNCNIQLEIGNIYRLLNNYQEALKWLKKSLSVNNQDHNLARIYYIHAECYENLSQHKSAIQNYKLAEKYGIPFPFQYKFEDDGWYFITQSDRDYIFYKKKSIRKIGNGLYRFWSQWRWNPDEFRKEETDQFYNDYEGWKNKILKRKRRSAI